jgi:succinate dehydrogenase / fumarate reductase, membrane anchor subunit
MTPQSKQDLRTPYAKVQGLGSAKAGTEHFWYQRLTALANVPLTLFIIGLVVALHDQPYEAVRATLGSMPVALALLALTMNMFIPAALGIACVFAVMKMALSA